ncbi:MULTISPECIES: type II secretion system F family protein [unclassified Leisingera]|uniref:type II secretion system F family protein n=1 Tax=unclassified Leisingera TaxID=2614906 RepID=UPI0002E0C020|nr:MULTISPECIES: type II secretion system F family protein [unclassified Leisingera]KIC16037.1 pilus assembly protein TadC [Leisingera sp. ANG-DT]KIC26176.1 pilus assembly protein TadC [Leisingera sp. ANG-S3]KIC30794.1 pilus assembly protein TadC [Leisingera sp. ANG-M6]KIC30870.1 pilus assembly protein TadC [Leisingera sp. ANG-S5]KIC55018.1 pilus assembly protein TadC [Leisingera sp. ANG-S]
MDFVTGIDGFLTSQFGEFGPLLALGIAGMFMILLAIPLLLNQPEDPLKKLQKNIKPETRQSTQKERLRQTSRNEQLQKFANFLEPQNADELSAMELKLRQAGYHSKDSVRLFHFAQFALGLLGLIGGLFFVYVIKADIDYDSQQMALRIIAPGGAGYMLPKYWITRRIGERQQKITEGFPDALDMMLVCVEAGQSLDQAIVRVSQELHASFPELASEFEVVAYELKAGKEKDKVLRDMGTRCGVQDVSSFVTVMIQSASFGTSIADALRVYAGEMRDKRVMRAEEAANKLPVKMTLATMGLTVPPLLIILVGPSVQGIMNMGNMGPQ